MASKSWLGFDGDPDQGADTDIFISIFLSLRYTGNADLQWKLLQRSLRRFTRWPTCKPPQRPLK